MRSSISVLNKKQEEILSKLSFLTNNKYYLAGGTALAIQLGHRTSFDFNFYYLLRALLYFEDIKDDERRSIQMTDKNFSWGRAKDKLSKEANKYQLSMFKK